MPVIVDKNLCPQNHRCPAVGVCPVYALSQKGCNAPEVDAAACVDCGQCTDMCPTGALQTKR